MAEVWPGTQPEELLVRVTTVSVVVQSLLGLMMRSGTIDANALVDMRRFALGIADDLEAIGATSSQVAGARLREDVRNFFDALAS
jgi:hypothetical protein